MLIQRIENIQYSERRTLLACSSSQENTLASSMRGLFVADELSSESERAAREKKKRKGSIEKKKKKKKEMASCIFHTLFDRCLEFK